MRLTIFNVGHGFCAYLVADNGNTMLFDCGHDDEIGFRPSVYLPKIGCTGIEEFIVTNYDGDHLSDLKSLRSVLPIGSLLRNKSISPEQLRALKLQGGPLSSGIVEILDMMKMYTQGVVTPPVFQGIEYAAFHNPYPAFTDTNNLSTVSFIHYDGLGIVIPGDIEKAGWQALLNINSFREHLGRVKIFAASHHGRESGYSEELFEHCQPDIFIISDKEIMYDTQECAYAKHATGVPWSDGSKRYVLTTRGDGNIKISKKAGEGYRINTGEKLVTA